MPLHERVVRRERGPCVLGHDRDRGETEDVLVVRGVGAEAVLVGLLRPLGIVQAEAHEAERVEGVSVVGASANGLFEAWERFLRDAPPGTPRPALERPDGRPRRDGRRTVVSLERLVKLVGELVGMPELDLRRWVSRGDVRAEFLHLGLCRAEISVKPEEPDEELARRNVVRMIAELAAEELLGLRPPLLPRERERPVHGSHRRARGRKQQDDKPTHGIRYTPRP